MALERIQQTGQATGVHRREVLRLGIGVALLVGIILYLASRGEGRLMPC